MTTATLAPFDHSAASYTYGSRTYDGPRFRSHLADLAKECGESIDYLIGAWEEDSEACHDDYETWSNANPAGAASSFVNVSASPIIAEHESAVSEIVMMIRDKFTADALKSWSIGRRFYEHAVWQKNNFPGDYTNTDFTNLASRIRDEVRVHVAVKPESIRVADWARCHVLREIIRKDSGDAVADSLSMYEYLHIVGKALHFNVRDLEGDLNPCWLDMVKQIAIDRANGRVNTEQFYDRVKATIATAAAAKIAKLDPAAAAAAAASTAVKATAAAAKKAEKSVLDSLNDGITAGAITPETALGILESVATHHGKPLMSNTIGFNPDTATIADCDTLAAALFNAGKLAEMKHLVAKLAKGIATMEKAAKKAAANAPVSETANAPV